MTDTQANGSQGEGQAAGGGSGGAEASKQAGKRTAGEGRQRHKDTENDIGPSRLVGREISVLKRKTNHRKLIQDPRTGHDSLKRINIKIKRGRKSTT